MSTRARPFFDPGLPVAAAGGEAWARCVRTPGGYAWWYFDALSKAGDGLVCIFFVGSVFSPSYAARIRRGRRTLPDEHTGVNLALYRGGKQVAWVMSEYPGLEALSDERIAIAGSVIERDGAGWRITIADRQAPYHQRIEGTISVAPLTGPFGPAEITRCVGGGAHGWRVLAPRAHVRARFTSPGFSLDGIGYHDRNHGDGRLEDAFSRWGWARFHGPAATTVVYSITDRGGGRRAFVARASDGESATPVELPPDPEHGSRRVGWGLDLPREFGAGGLTVAPTTLLEQAPFYARYQARLRGGDDGAAAEGLGEHLDLDSFRRGWIQFLLRYKMLGAWRI
ncbi:MAG: hypothetical protein EXR72_07240 [Myxococcales bacterium]|nr:hypothetical protein [Myxococcales bacterium]